MENKYPANVYGGRPCKICGQPTGIGYVHSVNRHDDGTAMCNECYNRLYVKDKQKLIAKIKELKQICTDKQQLLIIEEIEQTI